MTLNGCASWKLAGFTCAVNVDHTNAHDAHTGAINGRFTTATPPRYLLWSSGAIITITINLGMYTTARQITRPSLLLLITQSEDK